jgi:SAM-dependent methyltransferase
MSRVVPSTRERHVLGTPAGCWICGAPSVRVPEYPGLELFRCESCDFAFQPTLDAEAIRETYDESYFETYGVGSDYGSDEAQRRFEARLRLGLLRRFVGRPGRLLEIGSATGFFLAEAEAVGWDATGIEPCESVAWEAVERLGTNTLVGFIEDVAIEPASYDVVCGWHVLEHVPAPMPTLRKLREALRPGGHAFFEVPNFASALSRRDGPSWRYLDPEHHVGQFSPRALRIAFERAGFEVLMVRTIPMAAYLDPREAVRPRAVARRARYAIRTRTAGFGSHRSKFDLIRIAARAPAEHASGDSC